MVEQMKLHGDSNQLLQWEYSSTLCYKDPFNTVTLDVHITSPKQELLQIPTFWMGAQKWAVRFIPKEAGTYHITTVCSDKNNPSLHNIKAILTVRESQTKPYPSLHLSENKKYLVDAHHIPFFWLSDTWWMALSKRLDYPKAFKRLTAYRKAQGFNTIQLVAGLFPDMHSFDTRGENEAGFPWEENYTRINPAYFDEADKRILHLVESGFILSILGAWGYYLQELGVDKMKQHWRYIIARWGVYPVMWCIAGEASMPYYLSTTRKKDTKLLKKGWTEIGHYIKRLDPFQRLITIHPTEVGRDQINDQTILDINLLQASHHGYGSVSNSVKLLHQELTKTPTMPLIMSEINYEGILRDTHADVQRLSFWSAILSGSKGYGYGANGIWQVNNTGQPFGATPHGGTWGNTPWQEALTLQGAKHISIAKQILESYNWWLLQPQQAYILPTQDPLNPKSVRIAGIGSSLRIGYFYNPVYPWEEPHLQFTHLDPTLEYHGVFIDPKNGKEYPIDTIKISHDGCWIIPTFPSYEDWIVILISKQSTQPQTPTLLKYIQSYFLYKKTKVKQWILKK